MWMRAGVCVCVNAGVFVCVLYVSVCLFVREILHDAFFIRNWFIRNEY